MDRRKNKKARASSTVGGFWSRLKRLRYAFGVSSQQRSSSKAEEEDAEEAFTLVTAKSSPVKLRAQSTIRTQKPLHRTISSLDGGHDSSKFCLVAERKNCCRFDWILENVDLSISYRNLFKMWSETKPVFLSLEVAVLRRASSARPHNRTTPGKCLSVAPLNSPRRNQKPKRQVDTLDEVL